MTKFTLPKNDGTDAPEGVVIVTIAMDFRASGTSSFELPEGKFWSDVEDWYVRWDVFYFKIDGEWLQGELGTDVIDSIDWKRPESTTIYAGESDMEDILDEQ